MMEKSLEMSDRRAGQFEIGRAEKVGSRMVHGSACEAALLQGGDSGTHEVRRELAWFVSFPL